MKKIFICADCGIKVIRIGTRQFRCRFCQDKVNVSYRRNYANLPKNKRIAKSYNDSRVEYRTVWFHHYAIFKCTSHPTYKSMPFFDGWNPDKGGSWKAGADWIIKNIGKRPKGTSLHVVDHAKGFVPGNLEWTHPRKQANQQMFKIIAQQRHQISRLKTEIKKLRGLK